MGECSDRDDINTGLGNRTDGLGGDVARSLKQRTARRHLNCLFHSVAIHIVEHNYLTARGKCLGNLIQIPGLDLDFYGVTDFFA